ncbi:hypothetical protein MNEG_14144, partial [Monoraphidium neglectum]
PVPLLPAGRLARLSRADAVRRQLRQAAAAPDILLSAPGSGGGGAPLRFQVVGPGAGSVPLPVSSQNGAVPFRRSTSPGGPPRRRDGAGAGAAAGGAGAAAAAAGGKPVKRVAQLLPWMLLTSSRLTATDLTRLASQRALGALLEYEIAFEAGA